MLATMAMTLKSFLFGEDLVHWKIPFDCADPLICCSEDMPNDWIRVKLNDVDLYYDPANYRPQEFNVLATRLSGMQIFGSAFIITMPQTDFLSRCAHAPELPGKFRLTRLGHPKDQ